jgi:hypothetical protein
MAGDRNETVTSVAWGGVFENLTAELPPPIPPMLLMSPLLTPKSVLPLLLSPKLPLPQSTIVRSSREKNLPHLTPRAQF